MAAVKRKGAAAPAPKTWTDRSLLGKSFVDRMNQPILIIGRDTWTRQEMVEQLKCGNFLSARILTKAVEQLGVGSARELARHTIDELFTLPRVGVTTVYTWMCVLDRALGKDPLLWLDQDVPRTLASELQRARAVLQAANEDKP